VAAVPAAPASVAAPTAVAASVAGRAVALAGNGGGGAAAAAAADASTARLLAQAATGWPSRHRAALLVRIGRAQLPPLLALKKSFAGLH
jgi:NaMN:DMB phosphoribosyltransferase